jgi:regulator of protease activity HflC (stomatin/prohibitin superfamily)
MMDSKAWKLVITLTLAVIATILVSIAVTIGLGLIANTDSMFWNPTLIFGLVLIAIGWWFLGEGLINNGALEKSVPELLGSFTPWEAPPGISWWFPPPFGSKGSTVPIDQKTLDRTSGSGKMILKVLTKDDVPVSVGLVVQFAAGEEPGDALSYVSIDNPEAAFEAMIEGNARVFVRYFSAAQVPDEKHELAKFLMNEKGTIRIPIEGNLASGDKHDDNKWVDKPTDDGSDSVTQAKKMGFTIRAVSVAEINLPESITQAKELEEKEKAEERAEVVQITAVARQMEVLRRAFPNLTDTQILRAVQSERGKIKQVVVEGDAGDFTKGAVAGGS